MARVAVFGDEIGGPQLCRCLPAGSVIAVIGAEIRPDSHETLKVVSRTLSIPFLCIPAAIVHSTIFS
jgi:hypothetical protein